MKQIKTIDAVGHVLCHDVTQIIPGVTKGAVFRKGHIVREEDIQVLLSVGKEQLFIWEDKVGMLHENDAAQILCDLCINKHMEHSQVKEGKIDIYAGCDGLFQVDTKRLNRVNEQGEIIIASRHGNTLVKKGDKLAGTRVIPLVIDEGKIRAAEAVCGGIPLFRLKPFGNKTAGIVTTGSEILKGRITDAFTPVIQEKLEEYHAEIIGQIFAGDEHQVITQAIIALIEKGADIVICTGGMSVDPDDRTPLAIRNTGADSITYGAPVLPGAMFMLAYYNGDIPIMGLPGCVMYSKRTVFDLILPRIMAGEKMCKKDFTVMGEGGLCLSCPVCTFPNCGFGKGV